MSDRKPIKSGAEAPLGYSNAVLFEQEKKKNEDIYYVPAYVRLKVKNFTEMNLDSLDSQMNGTLLFTVFFGDMDTYFVEKMMDGVILLFNRDDAIQLAEGLEITRKKNKD